MNEKSSLQKATLIYLIVNIIFTLPAFIILILPGAINAILNQYRVLFIYWFPLLYYCVIKLTYLNILLSLGFSVGYILNFIHKKTHIRIFLPSILCAISSVFLNVFLIIKVELGGFLVQ